MKSLLSALVAALIIALPLCSCGQTATVASGGPEMISSEVNENITVTVFRCGEYYMAYFPDNTSKGWALMNFSIPAEIMLEDGGFGTLTTDVIHTYGGDQGVAFRFENVTGFEQISAKEFAGNTGFDEYVPGEKMPYNQVQICRRDGKEYMLMRVHDGIHAYLEGKPLGVYNTAFELEAALGLRQAIEDDGITIEEHRGVSMLVFRCGNVYLSYSTCVFLNEWWTPILNEKLENLPTGFSLEDGEIAEIVSNDILIVNGGDSGYVNAPMLTTEAEAVKKSYFEALPRDIVAWWTDGDNTSAKDGDFWQYTCDDYNTVYLIIFLSGNYHVYHDNGKEQYLKGVYNTPGEVSKSMGISDE